MTNSTQNDDVYSSARISEVIKDLYRNAGAGYQKPALFFEKIDELLLTAAHGYHSRDASLKSCIRNYWRDYFPEVEFNDQIENLVYQYRRQRRDWIWAVFKRMKNVSGNDILQLEKIIKFRTLVERGLYGRDELLEADYDKYYRTEVAVFLGDSACLSSKEAEMIANDRLIRELKSIYNGWTYNRGSEQISHINQSRQRLRDNGRTKEEVFVSSLIDQVCIQFVLMEIISSERFEQGMSTDDLVSEAMEDLWPIMPMEIAANDSNWISYVSKVLYRLKLFRPLLSHNYSDIRDVTIKDAVRVKICTAHIIAESEDYNLSNDEIVNRVCHVLREALNMDSDNPDLVRSVQLAVKQFYPVNADYNDKYTAWHFLNDRKAYVDKWYQWIIQKDKNLADKESADIARMWAEYNERLYLAENSVKKEVITDLVRDLSDKNYGNILAEMYLISQDRSNENPGEVLRSFFLLLKNMDFGLEPYICNDHEYPGWKINGEVIVDPDKED